MNPWLYLLSTICAHSCNFPTPQVMQMMMLRMSSTVMSTRFGVNQSTVSLCGASVKSVVYFLISLLYKTMWIIIVPLCNKHCNGTFEICLLMCATVSGAHMSLLCILFCSQNMGVTLQPDLVSQTVCVKVVSLIVHCLQAKYGSGWLS